jgi:hypothetical protein
LLTRRIFRTSWAAATALLLGACEQAGPPATSPQAVGAAVVEPGVAAAVSPEAVRVSDIATRLQAEYNSGARDFPPMSRDPRESLSPETMQMMVATAERLARVHAANAD